MAGHAQRRLLVHVGDAVENAAAARRVGVPGIAGGHDEIDRGLHRLARIGVGRRIVDARAQLELGMVGRDADVIGARLAQNAGGELVAGQRLHLVRQRHRIFALVVGRRLAVLDAVDRNIHRNVVALHQVDLEEDQLGPRAVELEAEPVRRARRKFRPCPPGCTAYRPRSAKTVSPRAIWLASFHS